VQCIVLHSAYIPHAASYAPCLAIEQVAVTVRVCMLQPTPLADPKLVAASDEALQLLGLQPSEVCPHALPAMSSSTSSSSSSSISSSSSLCGSSSAWSTVKPWLASVPAAACLQQRTAFSSTSSAPRQPLSAAAWSIVSVRLMQCMQGSQAAVGVQQTPCRWSCRLGPCCHQHSKNACRPAMHNYQAHLCVRRRHGP
jgi:hypothetical protein